MKTCSLCKVEKPLAEYYRSGIVYQSRCKPCFNLYAKVTAGKKAEEKAAAKTAKKAALFADLMTNGKRCTKCGDTKAIGCFKFQSDRGAYRAQCIDCNLRMNRERSRERYKSDPTIREKAVARNKINTPPYAQWSDEQKLIASHKKRIGRITGASGYKHRKHDANVKEWKKKIVIKGAWEAGKKSLHDAHVRELRGNSAVYAAWKFRTDAGYRLNSRLRVQIRKAIKGEKNGRSWETFVGYTREQLVKHLASMLPKKITLMKALDMGWHIDHIVPKSTYNLADPNELSKAWCLSNLRLIPAHENLSKRDRMTHLC